MNSFCGYLNISMDQISATLMSRKNKEKLLHFSEILPDVFARFLFGYEKELLDEECRMDISVSASNNNAVHNFRSVFDYPAISQYVNVNEHWKRLKDLANVWYDKKSLFNTSLDLIALEFDFSSLDQDVIVPSVFLGIEKIPIWKSMDYKKGLYERLTVFAEGIEILSGRNINPGLKTELKEVTGKSIDKFHIFQMGLMLSRTDSPVRICIRRFNQGDILQRTEGLLKDNNLIEGLRFIINKYCGYFDELVLVLDLCTTGITRVGIECYHLKRIQPPVENRWAAVLLQLANDGFCSKNITDELLRFPRKVTLDNRTGRVPEYYAQGLHHIKFSAAAEKASFAKIYLWSGFHWKI